MLKLWITAAITLIAAALLTSCGGDGDKTAGAGTSGSVAGNPASAAQSTTKKLGDCEYAAALVRSLETFTTALPSFTTPGAGGKDSAIAAVNTFDGKLATLIGEMKAYRLSSDVASLNNGIVSVFEDVRKQVPELKRAVDSGDAAVLTAVTATLTREILPRLDTVQQQNKGATERLNRCEKP